MSEIASAFVTIAPSARGFGSSLNSQVGPQVTRSGGLMGATLGKSLLKGFIAIGVATKIAQFLGDSVSEAREANKVAALTNNVIKTTGGVAKVSAVQVNRLADALSRKTGIDDEQIATSENLLLTFKNIKREGTGLENIFNRATRASVDLSAAGFGSIESTAKMLGKALNDPLKGLTALGRAGVTFTQQQQDQIKALVASGDALKAQKIILAEVESQVGGAAAAQATNADKARVALSNLKEMIGKALVPVLDALAGLFVNRVAPAITSFVTGLQNGSGAGGRFAAFIRDDLVPVLQKSLPPILAGLRNGFNQVRNAIEDNKPQLVQIGNAIKKLIPVVAALAGKWLGYLAFQLQVIIRVVGAVVKTFNTVRSTAISVGQAVLASASFFAKFAESVRQKFANAVAFAKAVPGKIKAALGNLGSLLYSAGQAVVQGLINGITAKLGALKAKASELAGIIKDHLPGSPVKTGPLRVLNKGYAGGQIVKMVADGMTAALPKLDAPLEKLGKKVKEKVAKLRDTLQGLKQDFASLVDPIASAFTGNMFEATTAKDFVASLMGTKGTLTGLVDAFKTLIGQGLNPKFLYELFQSGNAGLILDLAKNPELAAQAGGLFGDINSLSTQLGQAVAGATPDGKAITAAIDKTNEKLDKLIDATKNTGSDVGAAVNGAASNGHKRGGKKGGKR